MQAHSGCAEADALMSWRGGRLARDSSWATSMYRAAYKRQEDDKRRVVPAPSSVMRLISELIP